MEFAETHSLNSSTTSSVTRGTPTVEDTHRNSLNENPSAGKADSRASTSGALALGIAEKGELNRPDSDTEKTEKNETIAKGPAPAIDFGPVPSEPTGE